MKANFNLEKEARKALVKALGEITGLTPVYKRAPSFEFVVGGYTVSRYGSVDFGSEEREAVLTLLAALAEKGFASEDGIDGITSDATEQEADGGSVPASGDDGFVQAPDEPSPSGESAEQSEVPTRDALPAGGAEVPAVELDGDTGVLSIDMPLTGFTAAALDNLERLVTAKKWILQRMSGADELPIMREAERLRFPWFRRESSAAEADAYARLIAALCKTAKNKQRVTATERRLKDGDNEKFKARCFLLSLGFIGADTKQARKILLEGFSGNGSHSTGNGGNKAVKVIAPIVPSVNTVDACSGEAVPLRCGECRHHCYYTDGIMLTSDGAAVDTSKRAPDKYTHYCLKTPRGYRKLKSANDWNGSETPPSWCPLACAAAVSGSGADSLVETLADAELIHAVNASFETADGRDCLACSHSHSEPAETEGNPDRLFCVERQEYVGDDSFCDQFN